MPTEDHCNYGHHSIFELFFPILGWVLAHWGLVNCFSFVFPGDISLHRS